MNLAELTPHLLREIPEKTSAIGFVARDDAGQVLLVEPKSHYQGVSATFPKVQVREGESANQALARCLRQKVGARASS